MGPGGSLSHPWTCGAGADGGQGHLPPESGPLPLVTVPVAPAPPPWRWLAAGTRERQ